MVMKGWSWLVPNRGKKMEDSVAGKLWWCLIWFDSRRFNNWRFDTLPTDFEKLIRWQLIIIIFHDYRCSPHQKWQEEGVWYALKLTIKNQIWYKLRRERRSGQIPQNRDRHQHRGHPWLDPKNTSLRFLPWVDRSALLCCDPLNNSLTHNPYCKNICHPTVCPPELMKKISVFATDARSSHTRLGPSSIGCCIISASDQSIPQSSYRWKSFLSFSFFSKDDLSETSLTALLESQWLNK